MGLTMGMYAIDERLRGRLAGAPPRRGGLLGGLTGRRGEDEQAEALLAELEQHAVHWWPQRGDGKSWDVLHWAVTGRATDDDGFFSGNPVEGIDLSEYTALLDPDGVARLASALEADEATLRERLANVPDDLYRADTFGAAEHRDDTVADAQELVAFVRACASRGDGLLVTIS